MTNNQKNIHREAIHYFESISKFLTTNNVSFNEYVKIYKLFKEAKKDHLLSPKFIKYFENILRCSLVIIVNKEEKETLKQIKSELTDMLNKENTNSRK